MRLSSFVSLNFIKYKCFCFTGFLCLKSVGKLLVVAYGEAKWSTFRVEKGYRSNVSSEAMNVLLLLSLL